ncbi:putative DNA-binding domain [Trinorchestia longiramus]|nr:putative DNA-binding domain [Trinorchestia longiramus]
MARARAATTASPASDSSMEMQQREQQQHRAPPPNSWTPPHTPPHNMGGTGVTELSNGGVVGGSPQRWSTTSSRSEGRNGGVHRKLVSYGRSSSTLPSILRSSSPLLGSPFNPSKKMSNKGLLTSPEVCVPVSSLSTSPAGPQAQGALRLSACVPTGPVLSQPYVAVVSNKHPAPSSPAGLSVTAVGRSSTANSSTSTNRIISTANNNTTVNRVTANGSTTASRVISTASGNSTVNRVTANGNSTVNRVTANGNTTANRVTSTASCGTRTATSVRVWLSSASNSPAAVRSTSGGALVLPSGFDVTKLYPELSKLGVVKSTPSSNGTAVLTSINSSSSSSNNNNSSIHPGNAVFSCSSDLISTKTRVNTQNINSFRSTGAVVASSASTVLLPSLSTSTASLLCGTSTSSPSPVPSRRLDTSTCAHATVNVTAFENVSPLRASTSTSFSNVTLTNSIMSPVKVSQSPSNLVNFIKIAGSGAQVKGCNGSVLVPVSGGDIRQARLMPDGRIVGIRAPEGGGDRVATRGLPTSLVNKSTALPSAGGHSAAPPAAGGMVASVGVACVSAGAPLPSVSASTALPSVSAGVTAPPISAGVTVPPISAGVTAPPVSGGAPSSIRTSESAIRNAAVVCKRGTVTAGVSAAAVAATASRSSVEEAELQARSKQLQLQKQLEQIHGGLSRAGTGGSLTADATAAAVPMTTVKQFRLSPKQVASLLSQATLSPTSLTVVSRASLLPLQAAASVSSAGIKRKASPAALSRSSKSLKSSAALPPSQGNSSHLSTNLVSNISTSSPSCTPSSSSVSSLSRNGLSVLTRAKVSSILKNVADSPVDPASAAACRDSSSSSSSSVTEQKNVLQQRRVSFKPVVGNGEQHDKAPQDRKNYSRKLNNSVGPVKTADHKARGAVSGVSTQEAATWATFATAKTGSSVSVLSRGNSTVDLKPALGKGSSDDMKLVLGGTSSGDVKPVLGRASLSDVKPVLGRTSGRARWRVLKVHPDGGEHEHVRPPMSMRLPPPVQELQDLLQQQTTRDAPCIVPHSLLDLDDSDPSEGPRWLQLQAGCPVGDGGDSDVRITSLKGVPYNEDGSRGCHRDALLAGRVAHISSVWTGNTIPTRVSDAHYHSSVARTMLSLCRKRHGSSVARTVALIKAARHSPRLTATTVAHFNLHPSLREQRPPRRSSTAQRSCLLEKTTCAYELTSSGGGSEGDLCPPPGVCGAPALPGTRHCMRHITYNVDQQIFVQCCARSEARGAMCRVPVLCLGDQPLCAAHRHCASDDHMSRATSPSTPSSIPSSTTRKCRRKGKVPTSCRYGKRKRRRSTTPHSSNASHSSGKGSGKGGGKGKGGGSGKVVPSTAVRPPMNNGLVLLSGGYHHLLPSSPPHSPFSVATCSECGDSAACCCPPKEEETDDLDGSLDASLELPGNVVAAASRFLDPQHLHDLLLEEEQQAGDMFPTHCSGASDVKLEGNCGITSGISSADVFSLGSQQLQPVAGMQQLQGMPQLQGMQQLQPGSGMQQLQQSGVQQLQQCAADAGLTAAALDSYASVMDVNNPIDSMISSSFNQQELNVITQFLGNIVDQDVLMMQHQPSTSCPASLGLPPLVGSATPALDGVSVDPQHPSCVTNTSLSFFENALVSDACISQSLGTHFSTSSTANPYLPSTSTSPLTTAGMLDMNMYSNVQAVPRKITETGGVSGVCDVAVSNESCLASVTESYARKAEPLPGQDSASQFSLRDSEEYNHNPVLNVSGGDAPLCTSSAAVVRARDIFDSSIAVTPPAAPGLVTSGYTRTCSESLGVHQYNVSSANPRPPTSSDTGFILTANSASSSDVIIPDPGVEVPSLLCTTSDVSASPAPDCLENNPGSFSQLPSPSMPPTPSDDDMTSVVEFPSPTASDPSLTDIEASAPADIRRTPELLDDCKQRPLSYQQPPDCRSLASGFRLLDAKASVPRLH